MSRGPCSLPQINSRIQQESNVEPNTAEAVSCSVFLNQIFVSISASCFIDSSLVHLFTSLMEQGTRDYVRLARATHKVNTAWTPQYEGGVGEVWAYILKWRRSTVIACNILTYELMQCGGFSQLTVAWGWHYRAETRRNSEIKFDFNDVLGNLMWLQWHFKIKFFVALETETNGRVIDICCPNNFITYLFTIYSTEYEY
jgi:hypothetical protein